VAGVTVQHTVRESHCPKRRRDRVDKWRRSHINQL